MISSQEGMAKKFRNLTIALVAITLSVLLFLSFKTDNRVGTLTALAQSATPIEVATTNGKPSLVEFYANWCTSCQTMAPELSRLKQKYQNSVNFVMLNVDNTKWLPEILHYRVDGIPHFVFLSKSGEAIAQSIGEIPAKVMEANLDSLIAGLPLPYTQATGQVSNFDNPVAPNKSGSDDPRRHG